MTSTNEGNTSGSGRPYRGITITKDATAKISLGVLGLLLFTSVTGTYQLSNANTNILLRIEKISSTQEFMQTTINGYTGMSNSHEEKIQNINIRNAERTQENALLKQRFEQNEHSYIVMTEQIKLIHSNVEEVRRKSIEHGIMLEHMLSYLNLRGTESPTKKKINLTGKIKLEVKRALETKDAEASSKNPL